MFFPTKFSVCIAKFIGAEMETGRVAGPVEILRPAGQAGWKTGQILFSSN